VSRTSATLRVCPPGQRSAIAVNYTACPTRLRASGPLVINERSNLLPAKARANSLSLVKLGSKASPDWGVHQCGLDEVSPAVSCVRIFSGERSGNAESVNDDREEKKVVEGNLRESLIWITHKQLQEFGPFKSNCGMKIQYNAWIAKKDSESSITERK